VGENMWQIIGKIAEKMAYEVRLVSLLYGIHEDKLRSATEAPNGNEALPDVRDDQDG
jgi:hypothetical protein